MSRSQNLDRMTRYQWFESGSLQRRVRCELGRAWTQQAALRFDPRLSARSRPPRWRPRRGPNLFNIHSGAR